MEIYIDSQFLWWTRFVQSGLVAFIERGEAFASWDQRAIAGGVGPRIPISDELATLALRAHRGPCSRIGDVLSYRLFPVDGINRGLPGSDTVVIERCEECGFSPAPSNVAPVVGAAGVRGVGSVRHPGSDRLHSRWSLGLISRAGWDSLNTQLVPVVDGEKSVVSIRTHDVFSRLRTSALPPGIEEVHREPGYSILRHSLTRQRVS